MVVATILPVLTIAIFTRILIPADYGVLALALIAASVLSGLCNMGMTTAFDRNYFEYMPSARDLSSLYYTSLIFVFFNFVICLAIVFLMREKISQLLTSSDIHGAMVVITFVAYFFGNLIVEFHFTYLRNSEKPREFAVFKIIGLLGSFALSLFFVAGLKIGVIGIPLAQMISGLLVFTWMSVVILGKMRVSISWKVFKNSFGIAYPLTPLALVSVLNVQFDKFMIGLLTAMGNVGVYHIGKNVSYMVFSFMTALENVFRPEIYRRMFDQEDQNITSIGDYLVPFLYISIGMAMLVALFSEEVFNVLTPEAYWGAAPVVTILSMYFGLLFFGKIYSVQLIYSKKTYLNTVLVISSVVINILLNIPMIMWFGAVGAAWATMVAGVLSGLIGITVAQRIIPIPWVWAKIKWIVGIFIFGATMVAALNLISAPYYLAFTFKVIMITLYVWFGVRFGILSRTNIGNVRVALLNNRISGA
jgi:O-antigen/teichoic acid export membrane protein